MSGHNKWANIKHRKAAQDAKRSQLFTKLIRELTVAAREGGGDPESNPRLRSAIERAREANMPKDTIEKAIKRGTGELEGVEYIEVMYEAYAPGGVAVLIRALTDNKNRTAQELRHVLSKNGGSMAESGSVGWMFERKGLVTVPREQIADMDEFMMMAIEAGAEDIKENEDPVQVITAPEDMAAVRDKLSEAGYTVQASLTYLPKNTVQVTGSDAEKLLKCLNSIEELDDVQEVFANFEIDDKELEAIMEKIA
ncbi:MAG: hypothetical protein PWP37_1528 [Thermotogota bacterium]|nr:hypothetical protein [Thermotogota bacterium]MDK2865336.1 hypothetical protein [Thermotogota bacterium]HCZ05891.1 YebC/PmpR family DNA-binding transcriptional regulator [Thermotogota bacterium]